MFFEESFNLITEQLRYEEGPFKGEPTDRLRLHTIMFHTFVLMTLFNQINCRLIGPQEINICKTICNNFFFWVIMIIELVI